MITNTVLAVIAYASIIAAIVLFARGGYNNCNQDCRQGRDCGCDDEWITK